MIDPKLDDFDVSTVSFQKLCMPVAGRSGQQGRRKNQDTVRSLSELFEDAIANGTVVTTTSLSELDDESFHVRNRPRPSGYAAQTVLHFTKLGMPSLLDSCATCSIMPLEFTTHLSN